MVRRLKAAAHPPNHDSYEPSTPANPVSAEELNQNAAENEPYSPPGSPWRDPNDTFAPPTIPMTPPRPDSPPLILSHGPPLPPSPVQTRSFRSFADPMMGISYFMGFNGGSGSSSGGGGCAVEAGNMGIGGMTSMAYRPKIASTTSSSFSSPYFSSSPPLDFDSISVDAFGDPILEPKKK